MPYRWTSEPNRHVLTLWPHRSLTPAGFVWFIGVTAAMLALPLLALLGRVELWVLLPFLIGTIALIWIFIMRSNRDGQMREVLVITDDTTTLRRQASAAEQRWQANPYWITVTLYGEAGPVENYLTLRGKDREVELGAFLSPDERLTLFDELKPALPHARFQRA